MSSNKKKTQNYKVIDPIKSYNFHINFVFIWHRSKSYDFSKVRSCPRRRRREQIERRTGRREGAPRARPPPDPVSLNHATTRGRREGVLRQREREGSPRYAVAGSGVRAPRHHWREERGCRAGGRREGSPHAVPEEGGWAAPEEEMAGPLRRRRRGASCRAGACEGEGEERESWRGEVKP
jgi:hypothetical protein